jgi:ABC-type branched-subunit amino acid transport system ATPase component
MRLTGIRAKKIKPIDLFEVSGLSEVVVIAGPNGVGKSRLIASILEHLRNLTDKGVTLQLEATTQAEERIWKKKTLDTSLPADGALLRQTLHQNQTRRKFQSNILNFDSDRSIQKVQPYAFSWEALDPFDEKISWDTTWSFLKNRFQDTTHAIFRKVHSLERGIAARARELQRQGQTNMPLNFEDPLVPFKEVFSQLLAPKILLDADIKNQRLTYEYDGQVFGLEMLSSGEKEVLNITFDFLLRAPSHCVVFFDEPELHLHPELSYRLLNTLRSIGTRNQFVLCTHSPDIISATLDQSVVFVAPKTVEGANQAIVVKEDDDTNQALRLLGHSVGIVALGKKIVLVEGTSSSLDKQLYGSILKSMFPSLVLVPSGGKQTISSFHSVVQNVLERTLWGVDFFMLCDRDAIPWGANTTDIEAQSKGKLRLLPKYHLENFFLDENVLAMVFEHLEPEGSWLRTPATIRQELRNLAQGLVSYTVALLVSREFRMRVGNVDLMPKGCNGKTEAEIVAQLVQIAEDEKNRVIVGLDKNDLSIATSKYFKELNEFLASDDSRWKDMIPGKPLLAQFASKAKIDSARLKNAYIHAAENLTPSPFSEIHEIFGGFAKVWVRAGIADQKSF